MTITVDDVALLLDMPEDKTSADLQPFLDTATLIVTEDLAGTSLSDARKDQITKYLALHFEILSWENGGLTSSRMGNSSDTYKQIGVNQNSLMSTRGGQTAVALDTSGTLLNMSSPNLKAKFGVVTPYYRSEGSPRPGSIPGRCINE